MRREGSAFACSITHMGIVVCIIVGVVLNVVVGIVVPIVFGALQGITIVAVNLFG